MVIGNKMMFSSAEKGFLLLVLVSLLLAKEVAPNSLSKILAGNATSSTEVIAEGIEITGWTVVSSMWPLDEPEFYIATSKGHHSIQVDLPANRPSTDMELRLEYYYNAARVRPLAHLLACDMSYDMITQDGVDMMGSWQAHQLTLQHDQCRRSNSITYNFILHDAGDILAWRLLSIKQIDDGTSSYHEAHTSAPISSTILPDLYPTSSAVDVPASETSTDKQETTFSPTTLSSPTEQPAVDHVPSEGQKEGEKMDISSDPISAILSEQQPKADNSSRPEASETRHDEGVSAASKGDQWNDGSRLAKRSLDESLLMGINDSGSETKASSESSKIENNLSLKKDSETSMICKPSLCDRSKFSFSNFKALVKGLPKIERERLARGNQFFMALEDKPLEFKISSKTSLSQVDLCFQWRLFMDSNTELELRVQDIGGPDRLLESIRRDSRDSRSGNWEEFSRCISDYMPRLRPSHDRNRISLSIHPYGGLKSGSVKRICLMVDSDKPFSLNIPYESRSFLPDAASSPEILGDFKSTWLMDRDGLEKPSAFNIPDEEQTANNKRKLVITRIDPHQESFDLTSRWLQIREPSSLDHSVRFDYVIEEPDWLKSIVFESQSGRWHEGDSLSFQQPWQSQTVYVAPMESSPANPKTNNATHEIETTISTHEEGESSNSADEKSVSYATGSLTQNRKLATRSKPPNPAEIKRYRDSLKSSKSQADGKSKKNIISLPIKLKNVSSDEFRIRIRHVLKEEARDHPDSYKLVVKSLALGDVCVREDHCHFGGACKPVGTAQAECTCPQGYSGPRCEEVHPCEVLYGTKTGHQICEQLKLRCEQPVAVLTNMGPRCVAPDGRTDTPVLDQNTAAASSQDEIVKLREQSDKQSRLIIVMSVFMLALLLFAIVLVSGMVSRLVRSRRRLERAQIEVHELTKRVEPSTSTAAFGAGGYGRATGRLKPPASIAYNNQAFDAS